MQEAARVKEQIWRSFLLLIPLVVVLAIASYAYIKPRAGSYVTYTGPWSQEEFDNAAVSFSQPGIAEASSVTRRYDGVIRVRFSALADGKTEATLSLGSSTVIWDIEVRNGAVILNHLNFSGWGAIHVSVCVLFAALSLLFSLGFWRLWRISWYGYTMVGCGGNLLFCLFQLVFFTYLLRRGYTPSFEQLLLNMIYMAEYFALFMMILMFPLVFAIGMSNLSLVRHEGMRPVNLLGIIASVLWVAGFLFWLLYNWAPLRDYPLLVRMINTVIGLALSFDECLLLSTMACAWLATHHAPKRAMDYLVILGCGIRDDGTPCPLLAGRVDRAAAFDQTHVAAGDAPAVFVPSGGQGSDEPISEALSMGNYLQEHWDIPAERIALEDRSTTTRENMAFSREVIERHAGRSTDELSVGFSTTNYHVFRGYVAAHQAGMAVEGMGAKTKYYFWPNAFLREFIGLLVHRWKTLVQVYAIVTAIYLLAEYIVITI